MESKPAGMAIPVRMTVIGVSTAEIIPPAPNSDHQIGSFVFAIDLTGLSGDEGRTGLVSFFLHHSSFSFVIRAPPQTQSPPPRRKPAARERSSPPGWPRRSPSPPRARTP